MFLGTIATIGVIGLVVLMIFTKLDPGVPRRKKSSYDPNGPVDENGWWPERRTDI